MPVQVVLAESWALAEQGAICEADFKAWTCGIPTSEPDHLPGHTGERKLQRAGGGVRTAR